MPRESVLHHRELLAQASQAAFRRELAILISCALLAIGGLFFLPTNIWAIFAYILLGGLATYSGICWILGAYLTAARIERPSGT